MKKETFACDKCGEQIEYGYVQDESGNEGEVEKGHNEECSLVRMSI